MVRREGRWAWAFLGLLTACTTSTESSHGAGGATSAGGSTGSTTGPTGSATGTTSTTGTTTVATTTSTSGSGSGTGGGAGAATSGAGGAAGPSSAGGAAGSAGSGEGGATGNTYMQIRTGTVPHGGDHFRATLPVTGTDVKTITLNFADFRRPGGTTPPGADVLKDVFSLTFVGGATTTLTLRQVRIRGF